MDDIVSTLLELPLYLDGAMLLLSTWAVVLWAFQAGALQAQWLGLTFRALTVVGHPQVLRDIFALRTAQGVARADDPQVAAMVEEISRRGMWFTSSCKEVQRLFKWAAFIGAAFGAILLRSPEGALFMIALLIGLAFAQEFGRPVAFGLRKNVEPVLRTFPQFLYAPLSFAVDLPIFVLSAIGGWVVLPLVWGVYLLSAARLFTYINRRSQG